MQLFIITDIFGLTPEIDSLADNLLSQGAVVTVLDPYQSIAQRFTDQQEAYQAFIQQCGHPRYIELVGNALAECHGKVVIIGFSAGASAAWKAIDQKGAEVVDHLIGFYPSQIRHHLNVRPSCAVTLLFPCIEEHFDVEDVIETLAGFVDVLCLRTPLLHGFMNALSQGYSLKGAAAYYDIIGGAASLEEAHQLRSSLQSLTESL